MTRSTKLVTFDNVRRGMRLVDEWCQTCTVVSVNKKERRVVTRRYEGRKKWKSTATWTPEHFDARQWWRAR